MPPNQVLCVADSHARHRCEPRLVGDRQRHDQADLVDQHQPIEARRSRRRSANAVRIVIRRPNSRNATKIDSSVKIVRTFRRQRFRQSERQELHAAASVEHALVEVQRALRALGRVRIVRDHDDRLAVLAVERLQQVEDLVAGLAIEIAGRLVAEQQRRVGDDRARDADALLLAARELARVVLGAIGEADDLQRDRHALAALGLRQAASAAAAARRCARRSAPAAGCRAGRRSRCAARASATAAPPPRLADRDAADLDRAAGRRVEAADQVEQRRLARARRSHQREEVALRDLEVDALQHVDALAAAGEVLVDVRDLTSGSSCSSLHPVASLPEARPAHARRRRRRACRPSAPAAARRRTRSPACRPAEHLDADRRRCRRCCTARRSTAVAAHDEHDGLAVLGADRRLRHERRPAARAARRRPPASRRNVTFTPMSGRMRGSSSSNADAHQHRRLLAIGRRHRRDDVRRNLPVGIGVEHGRRRPAPAATRLM